jgi:hypothetical protein
MNLHDRSLSLRVKLDEAAAGSVDHELLERGRRVISLLDESTATLQRTGELREAFELGPVPVDAKAVGQAARQLRTGLSKYQAGALQHQATTKFEAAVKLEARRCLDWSKAKWKGRFERWQAVIDRGAAGGFFGDDAGRRRVLSLVLKLNALAVLHPITDRDDIDARLDGVGMAGWTAAVDGLGASLTAEIAALEQQQVAFDPEVRTVLELAAAEDGMPLADLTPELVDRLRTAGVIGDLVVRRA